MREYGAYGVSWPGTKKWSGYRYFRHPRTTQERRKYDKQYGRKRRSPRNLPNTYDDLIRRDRDDKSWKRHRRTQYKMKIEDIDFNQELPPFSPKPHYSEAGDCLSFFFKDEEYYAEGFTESVDLFKSEKTDEVIGIQIHGVSKLVK
jgi:hypothetical protein